MLPRPLGEYQCVSIRHFLSSLWGRLHRNMRREVCTWFYWDMGLLFMPSTASAWKYRSIFLLADVESKLAQVHPLFPIHLGEIQDDNLTMPFTLWRPRWET